MVPMHYLKNTDFEEQQGHEEEELKFTMQALKADIGLRVEIRRRWTLT